MEPWEREALRELAHTRCRCGAAKIRGRTFCYHCWISMPREIQKALYREFGDGYLAARIAAGHVLGEAAYSRFEVAEEFADVIADCLPVRVRTQTGGFRNAARAEGR